MTERTKCTPVLKYTINNNIIFVVSYCRSAKYIYRYIKEEEERDREMRLQSRGIFISVMIAMSMMLLIVVNASTTSSDESIWNPVTAFLQSAVNNGTFPGCVALVGNKDGVLYSQAVGSFTYGIPTPLNKPVNPPMQLDTLFDMASCSKVTATTTAIAQFYQRGEIDLHSTIESILGDQFGVNGKSDITVLNCLLHNSGFFPDPNPFFNTPEFNCPATQFYNPPMDFSCQAQIFNNIMNQSLMNPIGSTYVYSDLNFMTLMYVVGHYAKNYGYITVEDLAPECYNKGGPGSEQCFYEAYVRRFVFGNLGLKFTNYLQPAYLWDSCAPTENDTSYMHTTIQGVVSDGNAYAMGGVGGHAGVFSNAPEMFTFMSSLMYATEDSDYINSTTVKYFTTEYNHTQSSRAIGWNTNDPTVFDEGWGQACGSLSSTTWMHLGYTGTMLCGDPERQLIVILLTNRVYPNPSNELILNVRKPFATLVQQIYDANF
ncbi:Hypothetical protein yfeW precursor [Cavenderia fasciculata]|uniref:Beta-lactamase-related domain-containing protein n=1 Tax=Cavenderia fasciculata TaxID=261658 RepID=F4PTZ3_CACFS|nr:Hypothetical protein yfeW precursor [Cavenderia fasciculata]EGG21761.1 Hypothetical protein yfeW precursor [Cavenderia fasciculata]|eukprot:XP_004359611.1 Hypothetical protein yfeW precursor [Cavenderia fasciculata]